MLTGEKDGVMKNKAIKHLGLCLLVILLGICLLPVSARAEKEVLLSSFEELKEACSGTSGAPASILCTSDDLLFPEDFEIPEGTSITFRHFTVPEGITLSVMEQAEIRTYGFTVQGTLLNRGKVVQQDLSAAWADDGPLVYALIPGHVENKGEMILTDVFGRGNINRFGGRLIMTETGSYEEKRRIIFDYEEPAPASEPVHTPMPTPAQPENNTAQEVFDILEDVVPKLAFFLVLVCVFAVVKAGISTARKENPKKRGTILSDPAADQPVVYTSPGEDHFQRDQRKRIEQLDVWLKSGLIDRKEYNELKRRYQSL